MQSIARGRMGQTGPGDNQKERAAKKAAKCGVIIKGASDISRLLGTAK